MLINQCLSYEYIESIESFGILVFNIIIIL